MEGEGEGEERERGKGKAGGLALMPVHARSPDHVQDTECMEYGRHIRRDVTLLHSWLGPVLRTRRVRIAHPPQTTPYRDTSTAPSLRHNGRPPRQCRSTDALQY